MSLPRISDPQAPPHLTRPLFIHKGTPTPGAPQSCTTSPQLPMKKVISYKADPWGCEVLFTQDERALKKLAKKYSLDLERENTLGLCFTTPGPYILWVRPGAGVPILVHECTHASLNILDFVGIHPHNASGEPMCYTLQRMLETFLPHLLSPQNS